MTHQKLQDLAYQKGIFRYSILSSLLSAPPKPGELKAALKELAQKKHRRPWDHAEVQVSLRTLERWYKNSRQAARPTEQLQPKVRADKHQFRVLTAEHKEWLVKERGLKKSWSIQLLYDNLVEVPHQIKAPSYSTVLRFMREQGLVKRINSHLPRARREVRSFEVEFVGELFHMDFHKGSKQIIDQDGVLKTPICMAIIDDKSRLACHVQWFVNETTEVLCHGLLQAILKRGLPRGFYTDNGSAMKGEELVEGLDVLGIKKNTTLPYAPYQNGKQESFWQPLEGRLLKMIPQQTRLTLELLNQFTQAWVEQDYHKKIHSETKETPLNRFLQGQAVLRQSPSHQELKQAFCKTIKRAPRKTDCTVTVDGVRLQLPEQYGHLESVTLRYARWDLGAVHLVCPDTRKTIMAIFPVDKLKNSQGNRAPRQMENSEIEKEQNAEEIIDVNSTQLPPLLVRCLRDHAREFPLPTHLSFPERDE